MQTVNKLLFICQFLGKYVKVYGIVYALYCLPMNIEEINRKHFIETDMYYRVGYGLSSKMLNFRSGIITIEVTISRKWHKDYNTTALEMANIWKTNHPELKHAIGCKIFIIDTKKNAYKKSLIHSGIKPGYDAKKGILFAKGYMN